MADKKIVPINYTSRDFASIRRDLENYAKRYYPDTYKDFNKASFGSLMLDTVFLCRRHTFVLSRLPNKRNFSR